MPEKYHFSEKSGFHVIRANYWFSMPSSLEIKYLCLCFKFKIRYLMQLFNKLFMEKQKRRTKSDSRLKTS